MPILNRIPTDLQHIQRDITSVLDEVGVHVDRVAEQAHILVGILRRVSHDLRAVNGRNQF